MISPNLQALRALKVRIVALDAWPFAPRGIMGVLSRIMNPVVARMRPVRLDLCLALRPDPDLVVVSQGGNFDGMKLASVCRRRGLPYVIVSQKAQETRWPSDHMIDELGLVYAQARQAFFVSQHNLRLTEEQIGAALPNALVARNPYLVPGEAAQAWPSEEGGLKLACVGRLFPFDKGQDLILRVLSRPQWRARPVFVDFYGEGVQRRGLERMAAHLGVTNVAFHGNVADVARIWANHHALLLPSRAEGLPLVLVEAMMSGRPAIVTDVAGNAEVLSDDETGFVAATPSENALDEAMERAWRRRSDWADMGARAAQAIRAQVPADPAQTFADQLTSFLDPDGR